MQHWSLVANLLAPAPSRLRSRGRRNPALRRAQSALYLASRQL